MSRVICKRAKVSKSSGPSATNGVPKVGEPASLGDIRAKSSSCFPSFHVPGGSSGLLRYVPSGLLYTSGDQVEPAS